MMKGGRVVVVGGGIIGAAVFQHLCAQADREVVLVEQARPAAGASAFSGGILRTFHLDDAITDQAIRGMQFYEQLARRYETEFKIHRTGFLTLVGTDDVTAARTQFARSAARVPLQWLSADAAAGMLGGQFNASVAGAVYEPGAGYVDVQSLMALLLRTGVRAGGQLRQGVTLHDIAVDDGAVSGVLTGDGAIECELVVMCTGAWTASLAARLGVVSPVPTRNKVIQVNRIQPRRSDVGLPGFVDLETGLYGRPDGSGILIGCPVDVWDIDPDLVEAPSSEQYQEVVRRGAKRFQWLDRACVVGGSRRQDAYTENGLGAVAWSPTVAGLLFATGYSGGGVKVAPVAAEQVGEQIRRAGAPGNRTTARYAHG